MEVYETQLKIEFNHRKISKHAESMNASYKMLENRGKTGLYLLTGYDIMNSPDIQAITDDLMSRGYISVSITPVKDVFLVSAFVDVRNDKVDKFVNTGLSKFTLDAAEIVKKNNNLTTTILCVSVEYTEKDAQETFKFLSEFGIKSGVKGFYDVRIDKK